MVFGGINIRLFARIQIDEPNNQSQDLIVPGELKLCLIICEGMEEETT